MKQAGSVLVLLFKQHFYQFKVAYSKRLTVIAEKIEELRKKYVEHDDKGNIRSIKLQDTTAWLYKDLQNGESLHQAELQEYFSQPIAIELVN